MWFYPLNVNRSQIAHTSGSTFGDVSGGNYAEFNGSGFLTFYGNARAYRDFNFGYGSLGTGATAPDPIALNASTIRIYGFDGNATTEQVFASLELDHDWAEGTILYPHVHWCTSTTNAGDVQWSMDYILCADDAVAGAAVTTTVTQTSPGVAWTQKRADFTPTITTTGYKIDTQLSIRLYRNPGNDSYPDDAGLITFGLHVILNTLGSSQIGTK